MGKVEGKLTFETERSNDNLHRRRSRDRRDRNCVKVSSHSRNPPEGNPRTHAPSYSPSAVKTSLWLSKIDEDRLPGFSNVCRESLRCTTPVPLPRRESIAEGHFCGYRTPAGTTVCDSPQRHPPSPRETGGGRRQTCSIETEQMGPLTRDVHGERVFGIPSWSERMRREEVCRDGDGGATMLLIECI